MEENIVKKLDLKFWVLGGLWCLLALLEFVQVEQLEQQCKAMETNVGMYHSDIDKKLHRMSDLMMDMNFHLNSMDGKLFMEDK